MDIKYYLRLKNVERLGLQTIHRGYNLMEHQYMVAVLFRKFALLDDVSYNMNVFDIVLHHDIIETQSIDLPSPVKYLSNKTKEAWEIIEDEIIKVHPQLEKYSDKNIKRILDNRQFALFKAVDYLDLWLFIKNEMALGNKTKDIFEVESNCLRFIHEIHDKHNFMNIIKLLNTYEV